MKPVIHKDERSYTLIGTSDETVLSAGHSDCDKTEFVGGDRRYLEMQTHTGRKYYLSSEISGIIRRRIEHVAGLELITNRSYYINVFAN